MIRKGVYPHKYMDGWEKSEETSLPSKDAFYSRLYMKGISDQDYEHAQQVWNTMEKKTLCYYHDTYLKQMFCCWQMYLIHFGISA